MRLKKLMICSAFLLGMCAFNNNVYANDSVNQTNVVDQIQPNSNSVDTQQNEQDNLPKAKVLKTDAINQAPANNGTENINNEATSDDVSNYVIHKSAVWNGGWGNQSGTWYYIKSDGNKMTSNDARSNGWEYVNGVPYLFDQEGHLLTDTKQLVRGKYYILDENGSYRHNTWYKHYGIYYYLKADGSAVTSFDQRQNGWEYVNGVPYLFDQEGHLLTDTKQLVRGKYYILDENGSYRHNTWYKYYGTYHYLKADGSAVTSFDQRQNGWEYVNGVPYLFDQEGHLLTDTKQLVRGKYYILDENGSYRRNKWYKRYGIYYYLKQDGSAVTSLDAKNGWVYVAGKPYIFNKEGNLLTDQQVNVYGRIYYVDGNGNYVTNKWINGVYYGSNGEKIS